MCSHAETMLAMSFVTDEKVLRKVARQLRLLSSPNDGERVAATYALNAP